MNRRVRNQSAVSFTLSFLDVLCCGLGAATLLLLILKHGPVPEPIKEDHGVVPIDIDSINELVAIRKEEKTELELIAAQHSAALDQVAETVEAQKSASRSQREKFVNLVSDLQEQREKLRQAEATLAQIKSSPVPEEEKSPVTQSVGTHLTGLKVGGDKVLVLLDSSASMLSTTLVEIIRLRASDLLTQQDAPKWKSARSAVLWVYDKLSDNARFQIFTYSDSVKDIRGKTLSNTIKPSWIKKGDPTLTEAEITRTLAGRPAFGPTDLKTVLQSIRLLEPVPSQVVIVTDGLPTLPGSTPLARLRGCPNVKSGGSVLLSPQCRKSVMDNATSAVSRQLQGTRIDIILYPLEGDANAVLPYWQFADSTGGRLLSPVPGWPQS